MNIKDFYKNTNNDIKKATESFEFKKKEIKKMIEQGKKNGENINKICEEILDYNYFNIGSEFLYEKIHKIQDIVGGVIND